MRSLVSIIVVNWNGRHHLPVCLSALSNQTYQDYELILVDNGSTDGSVDYVEKVFPTVRVIRLTENLGFCGGNNQGIIQAQGEFIALINNDTKAEPEWLAESIKELKSCPEAGFTASRIRLFDQPTHLDTAGDLYFRTGYPGKRGWLLPDGPAYDQNEWIFGACAGAAVYRRAMLDEIGMFDETFFMLMEDVDLSFRAQLRGYRCLYAASAIVYHKVGASIGTSTPRRQYLSHRNHWYTLLKNLPGALWPSYLGQILAAEMFVLASAVQQRRLAQFWQARVEVMWHWTQIQHQRRQIQNCRQVSIDYLNSLIRKDWFSYRLSEKRHEAAYALATKNLV